MNPTQRELLENDLVILKALRYLLGSGCYALHLVSDLNKRISSITEQLTHNTIPY